MLDDLKMIHERDAQDALGVAQNQYKQLEIDYDIPEITGQFNNVVVAGMGGSALAAQLASSWPGIDMPYEICRNYDIPSYVNQNTLFIASSYSGNTEETLSALKQAQSKNATIVVISSGGALKTIAEENNYPYAKLPDNFQPRMAVFANFKALLQIFDAASVTTDASSALTSQAEYVKSIADTWRVDVSTSDNYAKQLALDIVGKNIVVYAGPKLAPAAYKWKISFNENAKNIAWYNQYPEFNHNEFLGWTSHPLDKPYVVIDLRSELENPRITKRFEVSERLLSGRRPSPYAVQVQGEDILQQLLWAVVLGDFVSIYLALLNGLNPTPVDLIEKLKKELA